jgi:hypothetical protein
MTFAGFPPVYSPPAAAENAFSGKTIASADWNAIFTDIQAGINAAVQSLQTTSAAIFVKGTVNFNVGTTDTSFTIPIPTGFTRYVVDSVRISGASQTLSTATAGLFTAAAGGGVAIVTAASAITVTSAAESTNNNTQSFTVNNANTESYNAATLFFRVANPQGAAATGTVTIAVRPLS